MDQDEFRQTYKEVNDCFCAFEKSVLTNQCLCSQAEKFCIAEREGVQCNDENAQQNCLLILETIRSQARFSLKTDQTNRALPHGKAIRIQVGGMRGLHKALYPEIEPPPQIPDIYALIKQSLKTYGSFSHLPFNLLMQYISAYKMKKRSRKNRKKG